MQPRAVILADGFSTPRNWEDRYFCEIGGEQLLPRTIRQFSEWADTYVLTSNQSVIDCLPPGTATLRGSDKSRTYLSIDMIRKGLENLGPDRTFIVFGDVYFTDEAVQTIREGTGRPWTVYGRSQGNPYTATPWAEYYVIEIADLGGAIHATEALRATVNHYVAGYWNTCKTWDWYYEMEGMPYFIEDVASVPTGPHWVEIDDLTDDVDFWGDMVRLNKAVANAQA